MKRSRFILLALLVLGLTLLYAGPASSGGWDPNPKIACENAKDDDGDGYIDTLDPGCYGEQPFPWMDDNEYNEPDADYEFNVGQNGLSDAIGEDDTGLFAPFKSTALAADCGNKRLPVVRQEYKGSTGYHHWTVYQRVTFCWRNGLITFFERDRWIWKTTNPLSGWSWQGWIGTNCNLENCSGRGVGTSTASAWTQGKWHFCSVKWVLCHDLTPLIGIRVFGNGSVQYYKGNPQ